MANVDIRVGKKNSTFFSANPTLILKDGQFIFNETTSELFIGDGVTQLSALTPINGASYTLTASEIGSVINGAATATPNDTDLVISVENSVAKKNTWTQIKSFLKTYFDTIYTNKWVSGSTGLFSIKADNDSGLDATGDYAVAEGNGTIASGAASHAEGQGTQAIGNRSHAEGEGSIASGDNSHAEGTSTASGGMSHAEGHLTTASGEFSHSEGVETTANAQAAHSEGIQTTASGAASHAGGYQSTASGQYSFVHGDNSTASGTNTAVFGANINGTADDTMYVDKLNIKRDITAQTLTASQIVETDSNKNLISAAKGTAYNKNFGTTSDTVREGDKGVTVIYRDFTASAALTGTTAITLINSALIPANTVAVNDEIEIKTRAQRDTATGTATTYIYYNTTSSLSGATLIGGLSAAAGYFSIQRSLFVKSSTDSETLLASTTNQGSSDIAANLATSVSNLNINWTNDVYIIQAFANAANGNTTNSRGIIIKRSRL